MRLRQLTFAWLLMIGLAAYAQNFEQNTVQTVEQVTGSVTLTEAVDYTITSEDEPLTAMASIDIKNPNAAVVFENIGPAEVVSKYLSQITADGKKLVDNTNARVTIYRHGAIVFPHSNTRDAISGSTFYPVMMYSDDNCTELIGGYNGTGRMTTGTWVNKARSFILRRGYMCTVANEANGTGYSHCYIANHTDRKIKLRKELAGKLGFFRIFYWQWPTKLGMGDARSESLMKLTHASWYYDWGAGSTSPKYAEYVPQRHHETGQSNGDGTKWAWPSFETINNADNTCTHVLGQNEPDNTSGAKEVYTYVTKIPSDARAKHGDYPLVDVAKDFLYSGKRIGTFACCNPNTGWVREYVNWCRENNIRVDFVATHYYTGGQSPQGCIDALWQLYNATGLPVWVTEWNNGANWTTETQFYTDSKGWYTWGSGNDQYMNGVWLCDVLKRADKPENKWLERLAVYNAVETKREIYTNGAPTDAAKVLATYKSGFAYPNNTVEGNEYFMTWNHKNPTDLVVKNYNRGNKTVELTWTHNNSKQSEHIYVQRKVENEAFVTVADIVETSGPQENNTLTYTDDVSDVSGAVSYRIQDLDGDNKTRTTEEVVVNVNPARGIEGFQYGNLMIDNTEQKKVTYATPFTDAKHAVFFGPMANTSQTTNFHASNLLFYATNKNYFTYQLRPWDISTINVNKRRTADYVTENTLAGNVNVPFLALNQGAHDFGGLTCEVGTDQMPRNSDMKDGNNTTLHHTVTREVTFQNPFPEGVTPVVLVEINIYPTSAIATSARIFDVTNTGFKYILYSESTSSTVISSPTTIAYLAIEPGIGVVDEENNIVIAAGQGNDSPVYGTAARTNYFYTQPGDDENPGTGKAQFISPVILATLQTNNYPATTILRCTQYSKTVDGKKWIQAAQVRRLLDRTLTSDQGTTIYSATTDDAYKDQVGWVVIATEAEVDGIPTDIQDLKTHPATQKLRPRIVNGRIYVDGAATFEVYNAAGTQVSATAVLTPGIYVVRANGKTAKILVK